VIPNVNRGGKTHGAICTWSEKGKREETESPHLVAGLTEGPDVRRFHKLLEAALMPWPWLVSSTSPGGVRHQR